MYFLIVEIIFIIEEIFMFRGENFYIFIFLYFKILKYVLVGFDVSFEKFHILI